MNIMTPPGRMQTMTKTSKLILLSTIILLGAASCEKEEMLLVQDVPVAIKDIRRVEEDILSPHDDPPAPPSYEEVTNDDINSNNNISSDKPDSRDDDNNIQPGSEDDTIVSENQRKDEEFEFVKTTSPELIELPQDPCLMK